MKRWITQILPAALIILKIILGAVVFYHAGWNLVDMDRAAAASEIRGQGAGQASEPAVALDKEGENVVSEAPPGPAGLNKKERELELKEARLLAIQRDITAKLEKITEIRNEIRAELDKKRQMEDQKLRHLIKIYSAMKPQTAATLIEKLDIDFAVELLSEMKGDVVGGILSFVNVDRAAKISEGLINRK